MRSDKALADFCTQARTEGVIALDLEFHRERTYWARPCLVQMATRSDERVVDPLARDGDLHLIGDLISDPDVELILHAGFQDLEIFHRLTRRLPRNVFDTQIAAALLGIGEQIGYGVLVDSVLGVKLEKFETLTDWTKRPLTPAQISYALDDVRYLIPLRDELYRRLEANGRASWLGAESAFYERAETYEPDSRKAWRKIGGTRSLKRRGLAVLRELAQWREDTARTQDTPRNWLVTNKVLVEIARRAPCHPRELSGIRTLHPKILDRHGKAIIAAVAAGRALPQERWPETVTGRPDDPMDAVTLDLLGVVLRLRALTTEMAPNYLGKRSDLVDLVEYMRNEEAEAEKPVLLQGWRNELVGADLVSLIKGQTVLQIDPQTGQAVIAARA